MDVPHHQCLAIFIGPIIALVNHESTVRVAATELIVLWLAARARPIRALPVQVIRSGLHQFVEMRVEIRAVHALVMRAGNEVPHVADDIIREEGLAVLIPIKAPRIGRSMRDNFKNLANRMVPPDRAVEQDAVFVGRAGRADERIL